VSTLSGITYTISGTYAVTNVTGGLAWEIIAGLQTNTICTHHLTATGVNITFPGGSQRTWNVDRYTTVRSAGSTVTVLIYAGSSGQDTQGENRFGQSFTTTISDTIASDNDLLCLYRPYSGKYVYQSGSTSASILFGTNSSGTPDGGPASCGLGYYLTYSNGRRTVSEFIAYW
jgi:hypothetical protein